MTTYLIICLSIICFFIGSMFISSTLHSYYTRAARKKEVDDRKESASLQKTAIWWLNCTAFSVAAFGVSGIITVLLLLLGYI